MIKWHCVTFNFISSYFCLWRVFVITLEWLLVPALLWLGLSMLYMFLVLEQCLFNSNGKSTAHVRIQESTNNTQLLCQ